MVLFIGFYCLNQCFPTFLFYLSSASSVKLKYIIIETKPTMRFLQLTHNGFLDIRISITYNGIIMTIDKGAKQTNLVAFSQNVARI